VSRDRLAATAHLVAATESVLIEQLGAVLLVTLNRPAVHNAVDGEMATVIGQALTRAERDPLVRALVITGAGEKAFCAGGDLRAIARGESIHSPVRPDWGFGGLRRHFAALPMIAAVNGLALGGGFEMALACDLVVAADTAYFALPEGRHGFPANPGGAHRLMFALPPKLALELVLTGRHLEAAEALERGLVNRVVPGEQVLASALELAQQVAALAPLAVASSKRVALDPRSDIAAEELPVWTWWDEQQARLGLD
jgi:crotonobetainyl-CoA hydratase